MSTSELVDLSSLLDDAKCFSLVRRHRWPEGVRGPGGDSGAVDRAGHDDTQPHRQRYRCNACGGRFDDLTGTVLAGHHQPLRVWVLCLYFIGLNLSNRQIAEELGLSTADVQRMTEQLRHGLAAKIPAVRMEGGVEIDEVYVVAGHNRTAATLPARQDASDACGPCAASHSGGAFQRVIIAPPGSGSRDGRREESRAWHSGSAGAQARYRHSVRQSAPRTGSAGARTLEGLLGKLKQAGLPGQHPVHAPASVPDGAQFLAATFSSETGTV